MAIKKQSLGKGLGALFEENNVEVDEKQVKLIRTALLEPNKNQPRKNFNKESLSELSESLKEYGMLQPIIAKKIGEDSYRIISGERRWRAARMAGITEVPVIVRESDDIDTLEIGLVENLQREDLNPADEAMGYKTLRDEFGLTQDEIAKKVGKSRPAVANSMRLLGLSENVLNALAEGNISAGHARAFLPLCEKLSEKDVSAILQKTIDGELTVRDLENIYKRASADVKPKKVLPERMYYDQIENDLSRQTGRKIKIKAGKKKGRIEIDYYDKNDFESLINALKKSGMER